MSPVSNTVRGKNLFDKAYMYESVARELAELKEKYRWHDAVKDPPKEEGVKEILWQTPWKDGELGHEFAWYRNKRFEFFDFKVVWWKELTPLPPERSGE